MERVALEKVSRVEAENVEALASAHEDVKGFVRKVTLLEGELVAEHGA
jgi:ribosome biogenesis protein Nip4